MNPSLAMMPDAKKLQLTHDIQATNTNFASAMDQGVSPGSDEANRLAEQHLALTRELGIRGRQTQLI